MKNDMIWHKAACDFLFSVLLVLIKLVSFSRKIDDLLKCFRNNVAKCNSSLEKKQAEMELSANLAGHHVICENNLKSKVSHNNLNKTQRKGNMRERQAFLMH